MKSFVFVPTGKSWRKKTFGQTLCKTYILIILYKLETRLVKHLHENLPKEPIFRYFCKYLAIFSSEKVKFLIIKF
jgi:hypothetical protein